MNKNLYRFCSKLHAVAAACLLTCSGVSAQVIADPRAPANQRPTILQTANGLPQVNVQTPSAAGVSRNTYQQFDVQSKGIILNNSRTNVQTQQGGWVAANPWLATGSARVILNEVNSSNPSYLNGYVEVAGQRAEVVIANPSGISVNGGGFINANKATLTTGTPIVNGGNLDGYRVQGGNISINGQGLDLSTTDYGAILARAVQVNAGIWATELKVVSGTNQIDASSLNVGVTPVATLIAASSVDPTPSYALDVAAIGGMYAGKIYLIGTEAGLGVRSAGTVGATAGDLVLQNDGWLTNTGSLRANGNATITTTGNISNKSTGVIASTNNITVSSTRDIDNAGLVAASQTLNVSASHIANTSTAELSGTTTQITASQTLTNRGFVDGVDTQLQATTLNNVGTGSIFGDHLSVQVDTLLNDTETVGGVTSAGTIAARDRLDIAANTISNREHALLFSSGAIAIGKTLDANHRAIGQATTLNNNSATLEALGNMNISAKNVYNTNDHFSYEIRLASEQSGVREDISGTYYRVFVRKIYLPFNTSTDPANILAGGNLTMNSDTITNQDSHIVSGGTLAMGAANLVNADVTATKTVHDLGKNYNGGFCGNIKINCWITPYESTVLSTVYVPQPSPPIYSGKTLTSVTAGSVSSSILLPTSSVFKINPTITSSVLVTTDPRFTSYRHWLGSDFMLGSMTFEPNITQKRLGDGFYEQKLVREQVAQLTGRRFLGNYTNDEQEFQALMTNGVTVASALNLRPGIALTAQQMAQLSSDIVWMVEQSVTLADGTIQKVLVPQVYVQTQTGDLAATGALLSGKNIDVQLTGDLTNGGTVLGRKVVNLNAANVNNLATVSGETVEVAALQDINNTGGSISATSRLNVSAQRDLNLVTTTQSTSTNIGANNFSRTTIDRVAGLYVSGADGVLVASAGRDVNLVASIVANSGSSSSSATTISAGNNVNLKTVRTASSDSDMWNAENYRKSSNTQEVGSQISGGSSLTLQAGNDLNARAASVQSAGALRVEANDINIVAGQNTSNFDEAHKFTSSGFLSSSSLTTRETSSSTTSQASNFGGDTVVLNSRNDIGIKGSNAVGDNDTTLTARNNITIEAATNTNNQTSFREEKSSGLMSGGGVGVSYGKRKQSVNSQGSSTTAAASTVGSVKGNVTVSAGEQYRQVGSDVVVPKGDISITAKRVDVVEAREIRQQSSEQIFEQSGISVGLKGGVIDSIQAANQAISAAKDTSNNRNRNLNALIAYAKGLDLSKEGSAVSNAYEKNGVMGSTDAATGKDNPGAAAASGVKVSVSIGSSKSQSNSSSASDTAAGSSIKSGGSVNIKATQDSLNIQGSELAATKDVALSALKDVNILKSADTETNRSTNSSSSTSVGVSFGVGAGSAGFSVDVAASRGKGQANSDSTTYNNSHITGGNAVNITSGGDTNVVGGNIKANQVTADVGGSLNVESLQDKATSAAKQSTTGVSMSIPIGAGSGSFSYSNSKQKSDSNYASVNEQSGIKAGEGGFQINVGINTDLKGAVIAGSTDASKNTLTTGTLTTSDISNSMSASASSSGVSVGTNMLDGKYALAKGVAGNLLNNGSADQSDASTTTTAVSAGSITVGAKTTDTSKDGLKDSSGKAVSTDTTNTNRTLAKADVAGLQKTAQEQQASNVLILNAAVAFADPAFKAAFLDQAKMYKKVEGKDDKGNTTTEWKEMTPEEKAKIPPGSRIANNGIFNGGPNDPQAAQNLADQNSSGAAEYLVHFPQANNAISELLVAGYQKFLEGGTLGLTNATQQNVDLWNQTGGNVTLDGHSRGGMTVGNALTAVQEQGGKGGATNVNLYGSAYNAQDAANTVNQITNGTGQVTSQVHKDDFVGTVLGGNAATGGTTPPGSSTLQEWIKILTEESTSHNNYGDGKKIPDDQGGIKRGIDDYWGGEKPVPVTVKPTNQVNPLPAGDGK